MSNQQVVRQRKGRSRGRDKGPLVFISVYYFVGC